MTVMDLHQSYMTVTILVNNDKLSSHGVYLNSNFH